MAAAWLTPKQLAAALSVSRQSVYRYREEGMIPAEMIRAAGLRKLLISSAAIPILEARFLAAHE